MSIIFRGKNNETKKWYYGDLVQLSWAHFVIQYEEFENRTQVATDSIGRFTGISDKNGLDIYEGDIVIAGNGQQSVIRYGEWKFNAGGEYDNIFYGIGFYWDNGEPFGNYVLGGGVQYEVIGNIYDNPEYIQPF